MSKKKGNVLLFTMIISFFLSSITLLSMSVSYRYYSSVVNRKENLYQTVYVEEEV